MPDESLQLVDDPIVQQLLESLVALAAEVNVLRDRVAALEVAAGAVSPLQGVEGADAFVGAVFGGMTRMPVRRKAES